MGQLLTFHVCTSGRTCPKRQSCDVAEALRRAVAELGGGDRIVVVEEGCLCLCRTGPTIVVSPGGYQYGHVTAADCRELVESHLTLQQPLKRLLVGGGRC